MRVLVMREVFEDTVYAVAHDVIVILKLVCGG